MLSRFINILLLMLVVVGFFFGVRVGKKIQHVDTPERVVYRTKNSTPSPTELKRYTLSSCDYSFVLPDSVPVKSSSQSALIGTEKNTLNLVCATTTPKRKDDSYINLQNGKYIIFSGKKSVLNMIKEGFVTDVRYKVLP